MQLCRCVSFTPCGGGQRERVTITNVIVRICESLPISPTPLNGTTLAWFTACGGDIIAAAGLGQCSLCNSGTDCSSPLRFFDWVLCVRAGDVRVSGGMLGMFRSFFIGGGKKTLFVWVGSFDFLICRRPITYTRATAISPCRRRIPSGAARERSSQGTDRSYW